MRFSVKLICSLMLLSMVASCNPRNVEITEKNKDTVVASVKDKLTDEERNLLAGYLFRARMSESLGGNLTFAGRTVGSVIDEQRKWVEEKKASEARAKKLAEEAKAKEEALAAELRKAINVAPFEKGFIASDWQEQRLEDLITLKCATENTSSKDIRAFRGTLVFRDLFGEVIMNLGIKEDAVLKAGSKGTWIGSKHFNPFIDADKKLRGTELKDMKVEWVPKTVLFADGSSLGDKG